ncbi:hypothetical protein CHS0354_001524, partial [Potamilus streckersoni]
MAANDNDHLFEPHRRIAVLALNLQVPNKIYSLDHRLVSTGRIGQKSLKRSTWQAANIKENLAIVQKEVCPAEDEGRNVQAVSMRKMYWLRWERARSRELSWSEVWKVDAQDILKETQEHLILEI